MDKGPSDYLQILKELFNYIEPLSVSVEDFNYPLSPDIPVCRDRLRHGSNGNLFWTLSPVPQRT